MGKPTAPSAAEKSKKFRVYLIDDHPLVVQGVSELINTEPEMMVVGATGEWTVALKEIPNLRPHAVVLDIALERSNGLEVLKDLRVHFPELKVLMLSMHDENVYAVRSIRAGAHGYVMKASANEEVVAAIRQVLLGQIYLSPRIAKRTMEQLLGHSKENQLSPLDGLSDRELEIFDMIGEGLGTRKIADRLHISVKTVETHKQHIKEKLQLKTATELTQNAIQARDKHI